MRHDAGDTVGLVMSEFAEVDRSLTPEAFVTYLDMVNALAARQGVLDRSIEMLDVRAGQRVLDLGCGLGDATRRLGELVSQSGRAVGIDNSERMLQRARARSAPATNLEYRLGDARRLELPDGAFDRTRAERLLVHLPDPAAVLAELNRVTKPGGRIAVTDPDRGLVAIDHPDRALTRAILAASCDEDTRNGWMGRQLPALLHEAGLTDITVSADTLVSRNADVGMAMLRLRRAVQLASQAGTITPARGEQWLSDLIEAGRAARFTATITWFTATGRKPGHAGQAGTEGEAVIECGEGAGVVRPLQSHQDDGRMRVR